MIIEVSPIQSEKAESPIEMTSSGITTDVSLRQPPNAFTPILVTPSGMMTDVSPVHIEKTSAPISVTPFGITTQNGRLNATPRIPATARSALSCATTLGEASYNGGATAAAPLGLDMPLSQVDLATPTSPPRSCPRSAPSDDADQSTSTSHFPGETCHGRRDPPAPSAPRTFQTQAVKTTSTQSQ
eukprot:m.121913 g.121913  ORF g.121913 m.121913 type:complete len:185 (+) comp13401_c0_seq1:843-1397(+)